MKKRVILSCAIATLVYANDSHEHRLDQIVVTGTKTEHNLKDVPVETFVITKDDIEKSSAQNISQLLKTVPGLNGSMHDDAFGTYTWRSKVRGFSVNDGYALVLVDGQRVVGAGQGGGMGEYGIGYNQVPVNMVERIEVVKGPGSALYGSDAAAGVINIITKKNKDQFNAGTSVRYGWYSVRDRERKQSDGSIDVQKPDVSAANDSTFRNSSQVNAYIGHRPSERIGYRVDYSYESAQDVNQKVIPSYRQAMNAKFDAKLNDKLTFNLDGSVSNYVKEEVKNEVTGTGRSEKSYAAAPSFTFLPSDNHALKLNGYSYRWDFVHGYEGNKYGYKLGTIDQYQAALHHTFFINENNTLSSGFELNRQDINFTVTNYDKSTGNPTTKITTDQTVDILSLYVQDEVSILDERLTFVPGLRFDSHSQFGTEINPKLALLGKPVDILNLRASAGRSFKSPTIRQLYYDVPYLHGGYYMKSNSDLNAETGWGYSAGAELFLLDDHLSIGATWFLNDMKDMVIKTETTDSIEGIPVQTYTNADEAVVKGLEVSARLDLNGFELIGGYTLTNSENKDLKKELPFQPKHNGSIIVGYTVKPTGTSLRTTLMMTGEQFSDDKNSDEKKFESFATVGAKLNQKISDKGSIFFEANNLFDSDKGEKTRWRMGRSFATGFRFDI